MKKLILVTSILLSACGQVTPTPTPAPTPTPTPTPMPISDYCLGDCSGTAKDRGTEARECFNFQEATLEYVSQISRTNGLVESCTIVGFTMKANFNGCASGWRAVQYYCGAK